MNDLINLFLSPDTKQELHLFNDELISMDKKNKYQIEDGIFKFVNKDKIETKTSSVRDFYLEYCFPNYNTPIKSMTTYKMLDLELLANKLDIEVDSKVKKNELYEKIRCSICWD